MDETLTYCSTVIRNIIFPNQNPNPKCEFPFFKKLPFFADLFRTAVVHT